MAKKVKAKTTKPKAFNVLEMAATHEPPPMVRTSERNDFKRCSWMWQETWLKGLRARRTPTWAWFGTAIHAALEVRYPVGTQRGSVDDMLAAFEASVGKQTGKIYTDGGEVDDDEIVEAKELGREMLLGYVAEYGEDKDWEVIHTEQPFQINVPDPRFPKGDHVLVVYCGTWDALMRYIPTGEFWVWDHKTRKSFPQRWDFYNINDQAGSYLWVAPEVLAFLGVDVPRIEGLVFNTLKKHLPTTKTLDANGVARNNPKKEHYLAALDKADIPLPGKALVRDLSALCEEAGLTVYGEVSLVQPVPLFHREEIYRSEQERVTQAERVQTEALWMNDIRTGKRKAFKVPTEDCMRCQLFEYCELDEENPADAVEYAKTMMFKRDGYADHREDMQLKGGVHV